MKIRCSLLLLALLANTTFLCVLPADVKATNNIIIQEKKEALTQEEKEKIFNNVQKELSKYDIILDQRMIMHGNYLSLYEEILYKPVENHQQILHIISFLTWLEELNLSYNNLNALPETIGDLINLTDLNLDYNKLNTLPETVRKLINLTFLDLSDNELNTLPEIVEKLISLTHLNLDYNKLNTLPETIGDLINLTDLNLSYNKLNTLPETVRKLVKLHGASPVVSACYKQACPLSS
jgi:Leucine-rich repeat (LRR) protein